MTSRRNVFLGLLAVFCVGLGFVLFGESEEGPGPVRPDSFAEPQSGIGKSKSLRLAADDSLVSIEGSEPGLAAADASREVVGASAEAEEPGRVTLTGRVVLPDGTPLADTLFDVDLDLVSGPALQNDVDPRGRVLSGLRSPALRSNKDGDFERDITKIVDKMLLRGGGYFELQLFSGRRVHWPTRVPIELNAETVAIDLGEVVITPIPVFVEGVVRDSGGEPAERVRISLYAWEESRHVPKSRSELSNPFEYADADSDGVFRILDDHYPDRFVVVAERNRSKLIEVALSPILTKGAGDLELTLSPTATVYGAITDNSPYRQIRWHAALVPSGRSFPPTFASATSEPGSYSAFYPRGKFRIADVVHGTYDFHLYHGELGGHALTIPAVEVTGRTCKDPRLLALDPYASLTQIQVTVNGPDGEPVEVVQVLAKLREPEFVRSQDGSEYEPEPWCEVGLLQHGQGEITMYEPELHLSIRAEGYETLEVEHVNRDITVQLKRGMQVRIKLDTPIDLTGTSGPNRLLVSISPMDNSTPNHLRARMASAYRPLVDGTCNLEIGQLGKHQVLLMLETEYGTPRHRLYPLIWNLIVPDIAGPGDVITIAPPQEWIAQKLAKE